MSGTMLLALALGVLLGGWVMHLAVSCSYRKIRHLLWGRDPRQAQYIGPESRDLPSPCTLAGVHIPSRVVALWLILSLPIWNHLGALVLMRARYALATLYGLAGLLFAFLALGALEAEYRYRLAQLLVDLFELDEALLSAAQQHFSDSVEPSRAAYEAAVRSAYDYLGTVTYGENPCQWAFTFHAGFTTGASKAGWYVPEYPWLQHIGGPALLEMDPEILLVSERLTDPRPAPVLPGEALPTPICRKGTLQQRLHQLPLRPLPGPGALVLSSPDEQEPAEVEEETLLDEGETRRRPAWYRFNAELPKFGRVRYPVLFGFRPQTLRRESILVRTRDGIPLQIPKVLVTFELYQQGFILREARRHLPPERWKRMAWQATVRLMQREASHWEIHSATALAALVMQSSLEAAFRKVFARYTAADLLDRVQKQTLIEILRTWPTEARQRVQDLVQGYLERPDAVPWETIHDQILREFNGSPIDKYPKAEERGLLVTQLSFGDWQLPRIFQELHRQVMQSFLAWEAEDIPAAVFKYRTRQYASEAQAFVDRLTETLPVMPSTIAPLSDSELANRIAQIRKGWGQIIENLLDIVGDDPRWQFLIDSATSPAPLHPEEFAQPSEVFDRSILWAPAKDPEARERNLVLWLVEARRILLGHPYGGQDSASGTTPARYLGSTP
ncbi:MAG: hypothetical protein GXO37_01540 [Chloroflexi bacterium]|nr:hypothetical protein [Chloroflexota bacterium]